MISVIKNATFISKSAKDFSDKSSGEVKVFYKALFAQDDSSPLEISVSEEVFDSLVKFQVYDLELEISSFNRKFYCTVVSASLALDEDFSPELVDIA